MRKTIGALALALAVAACGLGQDDTGSGRTTGPAAGACRVPLRFDGRIYIGVGAVETQPTTRLGSADEATCADVGGNGRVYFPENPYQRDVWGFDGIDPQDAIAVRIGDDGEFDLLVAESLSNERQRQIQRMLK